MVGGRREGRDNRESILGLHEELEWRGRKEEKGESYERSEYKGVML